MLRPADTYSKAQTQTLYLKALLHYLDVMVTPHRAADASSREKEEEAPLELTNGLHVYFNKSTSVLYKMSHAVQSSMFGYSSMLLKKKMNKSFSLKDEETVC